jgi:hypothetical protein
VYDDKRWKEIGVCGILPQAALKTANSPWYQLDIKAVFNLN